MHTVRNYTHCCGFINILYYMYIVIEAIARLSWDQWMVNGLYECIKNYDIKWRGHYKPMQCHVHTWDPWNHKRLQIQATNLSMLSNPIWMRTTVFNGVTSLLYSGHGTQLHTVLWVLIWNVINIIKVPSLVNHPRLVIVIIYVEELWWRHHDMEMISALLVFVGWPLMSPLLLPRTSRWQNSRITGNWQALSLNAHVTSVYSLHPTFLSFVNFTVCHCVSAIRTIDNKRNLSRRPTFSIDQRVKTWIMALGVPWSNSTITSPILSGAVASRHFMQWPRNFHWKLPCHCLQFATASDRSGNMQRVYCCCNVCKLYILLHFEPHLIHFPIECELEVKNRVHVDRLPLRNDEINVYVSTISTMVLIALQQFLLLQRSGVSRKNNLRKIS